MPVAQQPKRGYCATGMGAAQIKTPSGDDVSTRVAQWRQMGKQGSAFDALLYRCYTRPVTMTPIRTYIDGQAYKYRLFCRSSIEDSSR